MVFIGKDWRAPGEAWTRTPHTNGWEQTKLRPIQLCSGSSAAIEILGGGPHQVEHVASTSSLASTVSSSSECSPSPADDLILLEATEQTTTTAASASATTGNSPSPLPPPLLVNNTDDNYVPHCFVKSKSKEFVGCTSMSEAFARLDLARRVSDGCRFNYICKVVSILVEEKLGELSATARKSLLAILHAIVVHCLENDLQVSQARQLLSQFTTNIDVPHVCGSPSLIHKHQTSVLCLSEALERRPRTLAEAESGEVTFLDLPREVLSLVLRRLPDHVSLLETAKAHETFEAVIAGEDRLWASLCRFHFTELQIKAKRKHGSNWRDTFFHLKKYYGLREVYADLIYICCHCKALFWKELGHPCVSVDAPCVRVTPKQFVDMLLFL